LFIGCSSFDLKLKLASLFDKPWIFAVDVASLDDAMLVALADGRSALLTYESVV
jgi:hypothetical protein